MLIAKSHRVVVTMYSYTVYKCCISVRSGIGAGQIIAGYSRSADQNGIIAAIYTKRERFGGFTGFLFVTPDWTFGLFMFASFHFYTSLQIYLQTILNSIINITVSFRWVNDELYESAQNNTGGTPVSRVVSKLVTGEETAPTFVLVHRLMPCSYCGHDTETLSCCTGPGTLSNIHVNVYVVSTVCLVFYIHKCASVSRIDICSVRVFVQKIRY